MRHGVEAKNYEDLAKTEKLKPLEAELRRLEDLSESIIQDFAKMRQREEEAKEKRSNISDSGLVITVILVVVLLLFPFKGLKENRANYILQYLAISFIWIIQAFLIFTYFIIFYLTPIRNYVPEYSVILLFGITIISLRMGLQKSLGKAYNYLREKRDKTSELVTQHVIKPEPERSQVHGNRRKQNL